MYALNRGSRGWSTIPLALSTISPTKKLAPSIERTTGSFPEQENGAILSQVFQEAPVAKLRDQKAYSYREDTNVPDFEDGGPIAVMDGECALCSWGARSIARLDRNGAFRICPVQSPTGTALVHHYGLEPDDPETWLFLDRGQAWSGMEAIIRIGERLRGPGRLATVLRIFPRSLREWVYRRIARNRYRFGRSDMCALPDPELRRRLMT